MSLTTRARFVGRWRVAREIDDALTGRPARFEGVAEIRPDGDGLRYAETGALKIGEARFPAERRHRWTFDGPDAVAVAFEDGRPFHVFRWRSGACDVVHDCAPDRYEGRYAFEAWSWSVEWRVSGPRKAYRSRTLYTPLEAQAVLSETAPRG